MSNNPPTEPHERNGHSSSSGDVLVPPTVYAQLEALRQSGVVNMYTEVHAGLEHFGLEAARQWLEANPELYAKGFSNGFAPTNPAAVERINPDDIAAAVPDEPPAPTRFDASTLNEQYLLDHLQSLRRFSDEADTYYTDGSWRTTRALTEEERDLADLFDVAADCEPRQCYQNAFLTAASFGRNHDLVYVEGYTQGDASVPIAHAWVELNGTVVELTFPDGPEPASNPAYLGVEFPLEDVRTKILGEGIAEPLAR